MKRKEAFAAAGAAVIKTVMKIKAARNSIETDSSGKENTAVNANTAAGEEKTFLGTEPIGRLLFKLAVPDGHCAACEHALQHC